MMRERTLPYWLAGGTETCPHCTLTYVLEMEYRCVACDSGLCEQCVIVVRETLEVFCPQCAPSDSGRS